MRREAIRAGGFLFAAIVHALAIAILTVAVVATVVVEPPEPIPEPLQIDIGEQELLPPLAQPVDPEPVPQPPVGADSDSPEEADSPLHPNDEAMLEDPDEPPPEEITEEARRGLPGEPTPEQSAEELKAIVKGPTSDGIPKAFGVPIEGNTVFVVDCSGSMDEPHGGKRRFDYVMDELKQAISSLRDTDQFDIVAFSGIFPDHIKSWNGTMRIASEQGKEGAIAWLATLGPDGSTPTLDALIHVSYGYPNSVQNVVLVTDGLPDSGTEPVILASIKRWMGNFADASLVCIGIGKEGLPFVKRLVDAVDGAYVEVK